MNKHEETIRHRLQQLNQAIGELAVQPGNGNLSDGFARGMMDQIQAIEELIRTNINSDQAEPQQQNTTASQYPSKTLLNEENSAPNDQAIDSSVSGRLLEHLTGQGSVSLMAFRNQKCSYFSESAAELAPNLQLGSGIDEILELFLDQTDEVIPSGAGPIAWFWEELLRFNCLEFQTQVVDVSSTQRWLKVSVQIESNSVDPLVTFTVHDRSDLEQAQTEVEVSREFHRSLVNSIPDRFFITDKDHCVVMCNEYFAETIGLSQSEIIGRPISRILPFQIAEQLRQHCEAVLENSVCNRWEACWDDPAIEAGHLSIRQSLFTDSQSGEMFVVTTAEDTNQFHDNQIRLNLLASAYSNGGEGIVVLDQVGRLLDTNPAFQQLSGTRQDQLTGRLFTQMFRPDKNLRRLNQLFNSQNPSTGWSDTLHLQASGQAEVDSRVTVNPVHSANGAVIGWVAIIADLSDVYAASQRLRYQAFHDPLTGLASRPFMNERLTELFHSSGSQQFALFFLDLDDFKLVNDTAGHSAGDRLLQEVGSRLRGCLGPECLISRFGGDEFAILVPDSYLPENDPALLGKRIVEEISKPFEIEHSQQRIGVSVGVSLYPQHGSDVNTLMRNADSAMYRAKTQGKNQVRFYSHSQSGDVAKRMNQATKLKQAIEDRSLKLSLQEYCLLNDRFQNCNGLTLTWQKDGREVDVSQLAEESRLSEALGDYLLDVAGQYLKMENQSTEKRSGKKRPVGAVVRLCQRQLRPALPGKIVRLIQQYQFDPNQLELLVPEQAISQHCDTLQSIIQQIANSGIRITVENFGTGHSSLSLLKAWGVDAVSVDPRFIRNLPVDRPAKEIVDTILSLARRHHIAVYAQGVRDKNQKSILKDAGCQRISWHTNKTLLP